MGMVKLKTASGYEFWYRSYVKIDGVSYPTDELTQEQRDYVFAMRDVHALNAAYAGERHYYAVGLRPFEEVFPEIAAERRRRQAQSGHDSTSEKTPHGRG